MKNKDLLSQRISDKTAIALRNSAMISIERKFIVSTANFVTMTLNRTALQTTPPVFSVCTTQIDSDFDVNEMFN